MINKKNSLILLLFLVLLVAITIMLFSFNVKWNVFRIKETPTIENSLDKSSSKIKHQNITMSSLDGWYIGYSNGETVDQSNENTNTGNLDTIVLLKMTHIKTKDGIQTRVQYLPITEESLKGNLMDSVVEEPHISIIKLYNFNQGLYSAQYQNFQNEVSGNNAFVYSFEKKYDQLLMRFEGLVNRSFSVTYVPDQMVHSLTSENIEGFQRKLDELEVVKLQPAENLINQAASQHVGQEGIPVTK